MHHYTVNASIQIVPIVQDRHPYDWVDEAIAIIKSSGVKHEVGPFATVMEGSYAQVMEVLNRINEHLLARNCEEWITNLQIQIRAGRDITTEEKISRHQ